MHRVRVVKEISYTVACPHCTHIFDVVNAEHIGSINHDGVNTQSGVVKCPECSGEMEYEYSI